MGKAPLSFDGPELVLGNLLPEPIIFRIFPHPILVFLQCLLMNGAFNEASVLSCGTPLPDWSMSTNPNLSRIRNPSSQVGPCQNLLQNPYHQDNRYQDVMALEALRVIKKVIIERKIFTQSDG